MSLAERIAAARKDAGLTQIALAEACGVSRVAVTQWEKGDTRPKHDHIVRAAAALGVSVVWLLGEEEGAPPPPDVDTSRVVELPARTTMPRDLEVYGTAVGGNNGDFTLNGSVVDYVRRPPGLAGTPNAFAIFLSGDSMSPRFEPGELLFIHPGRPATPGRDVLVELHGEHGAPGQCYVKRLVRRTATKLVLLQFNPKREVEIPLDRVKGVWPIMTPAELMGV